MNTYQSLPGILKGNAQILEDILEDRRNQLNGKGPSINLSLEWAREKIGFHLEIKARMGHKFFRIAIMHRRESHSSAKEHRTPVLEITFLLVFGKCCAVVC